MATTVRVMASAARDPVWRKICTFNFPRCLFFPPRFSSFPLRFSLPRHGIFPARFSLLHRVIFPAPYTPFFIFPAAFFIAPSCYLPRPVFIAPSCYLPRYEVRFVWSSICTNIIYPEYISIYPEMITDDLCWIQSIYTECKLLMPNANDLCQIQSIYTECIESSL